MKPYSLDLRERVIAAVEEKGWSQARAAEVFGVSEASVSRYRACQRAGKSLAALPGSGGPAKKLRLAEHVEALREHLKAEPDMELAERCERLQESEGIYLSLPTLWRELRALGFTRKKDFQCLRAGSDRTRGVALEPSVFGAAFGQPGLCG